MTWRNLSKHRIYSWVGIVEYHSVKGVHVRINGAVRPVMVENPGRLKKGDVVRGYMREGRYIASGVQVETGR